MEPLLASFPHEEELGEIVESPTLLNNHTEKSVCSTVVTSNSSEPQRILDRDGTNHQSRGRWRVEGRGSTSQSVVTLGGDENNSNARQYARACWDNWFHSLVYTRTITLLLLLLTYYMSVLIFFAFMYIIFSRHGQFCHVDIGNFLEALFFSLSTMTTIGYGVKDYNFGDCWTFFILVSSQVINAILFDAVAIGLIFQRLSRGQKRSRSILFSDKAVMRKVRGTWYLFFRVGELRNKHFMIETRVRSHVIRHERSLTETFYFSTRNAQVGLQPPNDTNDGSNVDDQNFLLMSLPQLVIHKLDQHSPLLPPTQWYDQNGHLQYSNNSDNERDNLYNFWEDRQVEFIVFIEGIDEVTGMAVQARHSYRYDDIILDHTFVNCVFPAVLPTDNSSNHLRNSKSISSSKYSSKTSIIVDWDLFHHVVPAPLDCQHYPYITDNAKDK